MNKIQAICGEIANDPHVRDALAKAWDEGYWAGYRAPYTRQSPATGPSPLEALTRYVGEKFPGEWRAGVQVSCLADGQWYCAVHRYGYRRTGGEMPERIIVTRATAATLDGAVRECAESLLTVDAHLEALRAALRQS